MSALGIMSFKALSHCFAANSRIKYTYTHSHQYTSDDTIGVMHPLQKRVSELTESVVTAMERLSLVEK